MKGLKKVALASAIAAVSVGAQAELKALDDATLGETTGQAGLTIDLETKWTIGEFMYKDAEQGNDSAGGAVLIEGISLGGNTLEDLSGIAGLVNPTAVGANTLLDNARLTIDVAAAGETLNYGMSEVIGLAALVATINGGTDADINNAAAGALGGTSVDKNGLLIETDKAYGDGDLVIHDGFTDPFQKLDSGTGLGGFAANVASGNLAAVDYDLLLDAGTRAVDFNFSIEGLGIAGSAYTAGSGGTGYNTAAGTDSDVTTTRLLSDIDIRGYLGPMDIHIENDGNGFDGSGDLALLGIDPEAGDADSIINWDRYFRVTDLDIFIDIAGVQLKDIQIHNTRGDLTGLSVGVDASGNTATTTSLGFAHSTRQIYAVRNNVINLEAFGAAALGGATGPALIASAYVDGVAINTQFKGDIDVGHLSFGDTDESIGQIFLTDIESHTNWTISAH